MSRRRRHRRAEKERRRAQPPAIAREATRVKRLAYTRNQAAEALGISRSTFNRRVLPHIETVEMPWGAKLVPVDELERLLAERRRPPRERRRPSPPPGRPPSLAPAIVKRIRADHAGGRSLGQIARDLNASRTPTAHGGRQWWPSTVRTVLARASRPDGSQTASGDGATETPPLQRKPVSEKSAKTDISSSRAP
ncbi:MAG: recombinase family protein [Gaiellaceae bacterium]